MNEHKKAISSISHQTVSYSIRIIITNINESAALCPCCVVGNDLLLYATNPTLYGRYHHKQRIEECYTNHEVCKVCCLSIDKLFNSTDFVTFGIFEPG